MYVAFLDCTKAFDRISHYGLFSKLMERKVPLCLLLCLVFWYQNMVSMVKWGSEISEPFEVPLGIKQGGINSPDFFACYFDGLTQRLRSKGAGCHIGDLFLASILFADDICLLAPSRSALQEMITECANYCFDYGLSFNPKKSKIMVFSPSGVDYDLIKPNFLNESTIEFVDKTVYLGTTIVSSPTFLFSSESDLRSFYRSANSILNVLNRPDECIQMCLLYANCVPCLTYACAIKEYPARQMTDCNTALNDCIRKIFSYNRWESVRLLRTQLGYKSLYETFELSKKKISGIATWSPESYFVTLICIESRRIVFTICMCMTMVCFCHRKVGELNERIGKG